MANDGVQITRARVQELRTQLDQASEELKRGIDIRDNDPIGYLAKLIYANEVRGGSYGYDYGEIGKSELESAECALNMLDGNLDLAERVIVETNLKRCAYGRR